MRCYAMSGTKAACGAVPGSRPRRLTPDLSTPGPSEGGGWVRRRRRWNDSGWGSHTLSQLLSLSAEGSRMGMAECQ
eukprot:3601-Rhodomonas_salina.1